MWDYDKLFAEGNVVGFYVGLIKSFSAKVIDEYQKEILHNCYKNNSLSYCPEYCSRENETKIQYIIRLDEHGNVVEKLFDREKDMPETMPELETGMFVKLADRTNWKDNSVAYVDYQNNRLISKEGWYEKLSNIDKWQYLRIVEVFSKNVCCFDQCVDNRVIWRSPDYQAYLDSKSN